MKLIKRTFTLLIIILAAVGGFMLRGGFDKYTAALDEKPLDVAIAELTQKENYTHRSNVPEIYFKALVAVEDRRFYKHNGFDIIGMGRAIYTDLKEKKLLEGGSTLTQQLAKNLYFPSDNTPDRKIAEILMAMKIEKEYTKEEILEFYVNSIYYGSGYYCIHDAADGYFNKEPSKMTDYECTLLVGIPNAPSVYSLKVNPDLAHQRQKKVLSSMLEQNYITEEEKNRILENATE